MRTLLPTILLLLVGTVSNAQVEVGYISPTPTPIFVEITPTPTPGITPIPTTFPQASGEGDLVFFRGIWPSTRYYYGLVDSTRVHSYALTPEQISLYWNDGEGTEECLDVRSVWEVGVLAFLNVTPFKASIDVSPATFYYDRTSSSTQGLGYLQTQTSVVADVDLYTYKRGKATSRLPSYPTFIQKVGESLEADSELPLVRIKLEEPIWKY